MTSRPPLDDLTLPLLGFGGRGFKFNEDEDESKSKSRKDLMKESGLEEEAEDAAGDNDDIFNKDKEIDAEIEETMAKLLAPKVRGYEGSEGTRALRVRGYEGTRVRGL